MRLDRIRLPRRALASAAAIALVATGLAACGSDDDEAQSLTITASGSGKNLTLEAPESAETGLAEITLDNTSKGPADAQLVRVEGDHSPEEVVKGLSKAITGKPFPDWFFAGGGVGTTAPGQTASVTQILEPGTYYVFNDEESGLPDPKTTPAIEVRGEASDDELSETDATVTAIDYGFETGGNLSAGKNEITFENTGAQPHHILATRLAKGATIEEAEQFLKTEKGKAPFASEETAGTTVLEGGTSQEVTVDLKEPGKYAFYCFISDRQGGPPHVVKGMVDEVEVK